MILSELVRRGRGERILIVTPRHVLEQMQYELWCRFALPSVRLDSAGIQKVRQKLPATRNPFTYYRRAIIAIDTLKQEKYDKILRKHRWDAVAIDESHNLTNVGTQNNALARLLAPNTAALILVSATPHNGRKESFAELLRLLDPTVVWPDGSFRHDDVATLLIRRHRHHAEVGGDWADRAEPINVRVDPSPKEDAVATELSEIWLHPRGGRSSYSGENATLFPWTLAKAFLSSPPALAESIAQRRRTVLGGTETPARRAALTVEQHAEITALDTLAKLNYAAGPTAGKFDALVARLNQIGVGARSDMRAVVFAERIKTLEWLTGRLPEELDLADIPVRIMHGGLSDIEQQEIVAGFKQSTSRIRVLAADVFAATIKGRIDDAADPYTIAVLTRGVDARNRMVRALTERRVEAGALDDFVIAIGLVAVLTMHCAKGTEFSRVVLAGIGKSSIPSAASVKSVPEEEKADALQRERSLLNVASSRARGELVVTWVGEQSDLHGVHGVEPAMGGN